ncbi:right-handed parallel beta-helix repeat-containing protein [Paenibacillus ginsengarvi]|uniref:Right-handed parallel beta-helix repeat-containing protein n=1 Tax=Paenibacillus ginsengarvi TaxID=400777 RepID=A0A3B0BN64_9BACL|nr:right-handed parallel beta-helix repeat-containing protein [Paenibacillus ginsengarvi]RKN74873.1 right-handed parallel beta-helix repeat-containing protein [Paenibacillus ginsengarvi]
METISRRKLLATLGAAGATLATGGMLNAGAGVAYGQASVTENVYGKEDKVDGKFHWKDLENIDFCVKTTLSELRGGADTRPEDAYFVTDSGKEGCFLYDPTDTSTPDNTGTVVVTAGGKRFKRVMTGTVSASWFGAKGDGATVETAALQNALNAAAGRKLWIPKQANGFYLTGQLFVPGDIVIEFEPGTVVQAIDTLNLKAPYERLIRIKNVKNVLILGNGAVLKMNKAAYLTGEQAHIFDISGSENVTIERLSANDSGGDGFYVGNYEATKSYCKNVVLRDCTADNNRRQGLSIISVDGFLADGCRFTNTTGTAPKSGVDIEPNNNTGVDVLKKVRFVGCMADGNVGRGFLVSLQKLTASNERVDITFENCRTRGNSFGSSVNYGGDGVRAVKGDVKFIDCMAENEQYGGYSVLSNSSESVKTTFVRCKAINCNTVNAPEDPYGYGASFIVSTVPQQPRAAIGNVEFIGCSSIDDRAAPLIVRGFAVKRNGNEAIRNVIFDNCRVIGGAQSLYHIDPMTEDVHAATAPSPVRNVTASGPVNTSWIGHTITNAGASGDMALTLPPAKRGYTYKFAVEDAHAIKLVPQPGAAIFKPAGGGPDVQSANRGDSISLVGRSDGNWEVAGAVGIWY